MSLQKPRAGRKETERDFLLLLWTDHPQHQVILEWLQAIPPTERQMRVRDLLYTAITGQNPVPSYAGSSGGTGTATTTEPAIQREAPAPVAPAPATTAGLPTSLTAFTETE